MSCQITPRRHDPGTVEQTGTDRIADREADLASVARRANGGEPGSGDLLGKKHAAQSAELQRAVEVDVLFAFGIAVGKVSVDVDEARHDEAVESSRASGLLGSAAAPRLPGRRSRSSRAHQTTRMSPGRASSSRPVKSWPQRTKVFIADSVERNPQRAIVIARNGGLDIIAIPMCSKRKQSSGRKQPLADDQFHPCQPARRDGAADPRSGLVGNAARRRRNLARKPQTDCHRDPRLRISDGGPMGP